MPLSRRASLRCELKTAAKSSPHAGRARAPVETPLNWLLSTLDAAQPGSPCRVRIDRARESCHTPRRNEEVAAALVALRKIDNWARAAFAFMNELVPVSDSASAPARADVSQWNAAGLLVPVVFLEKEEDRAARPAPEAAAAALAAQTAGLAAQPISLIGAAAAPAAPAAAPAAAPSGGAVMDLASVNRLLAEAYAGLRARCDGLASSLPRPDSQALLTGAEAAFVVAGEYVARVARAGEAGVAHLESLLMDQLVSAVGKVLQPQDFDAFMRFHARKLFRPAYEPRPLCFSVRRSPDHTPEGVLRIEDAAVDGAPAEPIFTISACVAGGARAVAAHAGAGPAGPAASASASASAARMHFALSAETRVQFGGSVHLHAWLAHRFSASPGGEGEGGGGGEGRRPHRFGSPHSATRALTLAAQARSFSSFILLVGKISSPTSFEPVSAVIVKDRDEVLVPLALSEIPTPKEFKDAIASLSPEQQRFAKAFRGMQLESTLFGVLVLHIKPQLERLLRLAPDALTKEFGFTATYPGTKEGAAKAGAK